MTAESLPASTPKRPWLTGLRLALIILAFQLAMIPFGNITRGGSLRDMSASDFSKRGFNAGPDSFVAWKTYAWSRTDTPPDLQRHGVWGLNYNVVPGFCSYVMVSFVWTIGLNTVAVLWLGRRGIARAWRTRPRLPRVRLVIERRPRATA